MPRCRVNKALTPLRQIPLAGGRQPFPFTVPRLILHQPGCQPFLAISAAGIGGKAVD
jgi:hypothetical protein